jgi:hypothetical protein
VGRAGSKPQELEAAHEGGQKHRSFAGWL